VALQQLETAGALRRLPEVDYEQVRVEAAPLAAPALAAIGRQVAAHRENKQRQLERMTAYAQGEDCRRLTLLRHFGD
jgi:hypothetical protein